MRRKTFFTIFLVALVSFQTWSQSKGVFTDSNRQTLSALGSGDISINMPSGMTLPVMANEGYVLAKIDFGTEYDLGKSTGPNQFEFKVDFLIKGFSGAAELFSEPNSITVTNTRPEAAIQRSLDDYFDELQSNGLSIDRIEVSQVTTSDELGTSSALALSRLEIELSYSINLGIDVRGFGSGINGSSVVSNGKIGTFNWVSDHDYPNYQLQVLRLYNTDELLVSNEAIVEADVNWELAVNFETESNATSLRATISEGTGVYVWRVRPIGTYFENGIGNNNNWGEWSNAISGTVTNTTGQDFFYFDEPDDDINFIYNRSFTEGNKQSEQITYADGLQNVRQSQAYLPPN